MDVNQFDQLDDTRKTEAILKGIFLAARLTERHYIKLYNIDQFYVEVYFDDRNHLITHFRASALTRFVLPYLERLQVAI